jgi:hypothetical protein
MALQAADQRPLEETAFVQSLGNGDRKYIAGRPVAAHLGDRRGRFAGRCERSPRYRSCGSERCDGGEEVSAKHQSSSPKKFVLGRRVSQTKMPTSDIRAATFIQIVR